MDKGQELLLEEQLDTLKALITEIGGLKEALTGELQVKQANNPEKLEVSGAVQVNTEKEVAITNVDAFVKGLDDLGNKLATIIEQNAHKPLDTVTVANIEAALAKELKVTNFGELQDDLIAIRDAVINSQAVVNVEKQDVVFPTDPRKPIAVRLSDGKSFYNAIAAAISSGVNTTGLATETKQDAIVSAIENISVTSTPDRATNAYSISAVSDDGTYKYFYFEDASLNYYIMRKHKTNKTFSYTKGTGGYSSVYVSSSAGPSGSPTWGTYGATF